ncbi:MAG: putative glycoside hydrolase [Patescibacteria group bacterium]
MTFVRVIFSFCTLALVTLLAHAAYAVEMKKTYPKLANYFLHWTVSDEEAKALSRWDLLILDAEVPYRSPQAIPAIRQLNPNVIILAYVPAGELRADWAHLREVAPLRYKLGNTVPQEWYLKDASGAQRSFWPGTWILNATERSPVIFGKQWNDFLPEFVSREILSRPEWDGVFYDNGWEGISYFAGGAVDSDGNGKAEDAKTADKLWQEGLRGIYRKTREQAPGKIVMENDGLVYAPDVDGVFLENFSESKDWKTTAANLKKAVQLSKKNLAVLNTNSQNTGERNNWRLMRYGFAMALLHDGFYSFDYGDQDHGQTWWYDEYETYLGAPLGPFRQLSGGVLRRDFESGVVVVNTTDKQAKVSFAEDFERLRGVQDASVNDGSIVSTLSFAAKDAVVLRRPLQDIFDAPYLNGAFVRVFNSKGESVRTGFFAYDAAFPSGAVVMKVDIDGDKKRETVWVYRGVLTIEHQGKSLKIRPYGEQWTGELMLGVGDLTGDGLQEIVVTAHEESGAEIRVYRNTGELMTAPWKAFGGGYRGGAHIGVGDLNGDGIAEVVIGSSRGGGPQVRVFNYQGRLLSGGFFAFDPRFRGGVRPTVGDLDGDGRGEIITGADIGGGPQVRVFDAKGKSILQGFFAFDSSGRSGVNPVISDIDGDGIPEILATTTAVFGGL